MHQCAYICMYALCMYVARHAWVHINMYVYVDRYALMSVCIYVYMNVCRWTGIMSVSISMYLYVCTYLCTHVFVYIYMYVSHRGVFRTIKSLVHALGASSSMTEPTINSSL